MSGVKSFKFPPKVQKNIITYLDSRYQDFPIQLQRERCENIDKALQLESDARRRNDEGSVTRDYYTDTEIPTVRSPVNKVANFLIDLFVGPRIFEVVSENPEYKPAVKQFNAIIEENSKATNWGKELVVLLRDISKYHYAGISCNWEREEVLSIVNDSTTPTSNTSGASVKSIGREGNKLDRLDPYNTGYDTSVPINEVHTRGEYSFTIERVSRVDLFKMITNLKLGNNKVMNEDKIWQNQQTTPHRYYSPEVRTVYDTEIQGNGWLDFFGGNGFQPAGTGHIQELKKTGKGGRYELIKLSCRIIPSMFGMNVPAANSVQIWKFYIVNWTTLIYAERQTNAHNYLDTIFVQINEEGLGEQSKSNAEFLIPIQNLATSTHDARLAGLKRQVSDRALYDSTRINRKHVTSERPDAKIPVKPSLTSPGIDGAYRQIPYNDNTAAGLYQELQFLDNMANRTVGLNNPQQGAFQKGNKTLGEFNEVMNNADDDLRTIGKLVESTAMVPIKTIIKTNILQYQPVKDIVTETGESINVNPVEIRKAALQFKLADGLISKDTLLDLPTANSLLNLVLSVPALQQEYNLSKLVDHIMSSVGFDTAQFNNGGTGGPQPQPQPQGDSNANQ